MPILNEDRPAPFIKSIADIFYRNASNELYRYRFIFQNKRTGLFFHYYLKEQAKRDQIGLILPEVTTLNDLLRKKLHLSEEDINNKLFIIFEIYQLYLELFSNNEAPQQRIEKISFNDFFHIGELILNDFNDMDKHLINIELIMKNASELAELSVDPSSFLSQKQAEALRMFNSGITIDFNDAKHPVKAVFDRFWVKMPLLYKRLKERLASKGLAYEGMVCRKIYDGLINHDLDLSSPGITNVFVGLNALTKSEEKILEHLQAEKECPPLFYWDYDSHILQEGYLAGKFNKKNKEKFPEPKEGHPFHRSSSKQINTLLPEVEVVSIPSNVAQAKFIGDRLKALSKETENLEVAVVLPDERLLMPFLGNLPAEIKQVNITMGYPIRETPIVGMLLRIIQLHKLYYARGEKWRGEEIIEVLSFSPLQKSVPITTKESISSTIYNQKRYYISPTEIDYLTEENKLINFILKLPQKQERNAIWLLNYLTYLIKCLMAQLDPSKEEEEQNTYQGEYTIYYTIQNLLEREIKSINNYKGDSIDEHPFTVEMMTNLLKGVLSQARVPYKGEPLKGLQIMGLLETRGLDFKQIFIPDAAEGKLPTKTKVLGILPKELRYGFGMPTYQWQDYTRAYNFFRLICRASHVTATYDSRKGALSVGEPSRYILLLDYLYGANVTYATANYQLISLPTKENIIDQERLRIYIDRLTNKEHPHPIHLSVSSLYSYISCPKRFYYEMILGLKGAEELEEILQPRDIGNLLHKSIGTIYDEFTDKFIDPKRLSLYHNPESIEKVVASNYLSLFNNKEPQGINQIAFDNTIDMILKIIKEDLDILEGHDIFYIGGEKKITAYLDLKDIGIEEGVHFKGYIDRIDRIDPHDKKDSSYIRVIDYKTGNNKPEIKFKEISSVALQLLFYCYILSFDEEYAKYALRPLMCKPGNTGQAMMPLIHNKKELKTFDEVVEIFTDQLLSHIKELIQDTKFNANNNRCSFCPATSICSDYKPPFPT